MNVKTLGSGMLAEVNNKNICKMFNQKIYIFGGITLGMK